MNLRVWVFLIGLSFLPACQEDEENPSLRKVIGSYEGYINYFDKPIPGGNKSQTVNFIIVKESNDKIRIRTSFDLVLPVTRTFTDESNGRIDEIITLGADKEINYDSDGIEISAGNTQFGEWGKMGGYFHVMEKRLTISFGWNKGTEGSGGILVGVRKD